MRLWIAVQKQNGWPTSPDQYVDYRAAGLDRLASESGKEVHWTAGRRLSKGRRHRGGHSSSTYAQAALKESTPSKHVFPCNPAGVWNDNCHITLQFDSRRLHRSSSVAGPRRLNVRLVCKRPIGRRYSITSSARASSVAGTVMPSALAVFILMTSWKRVGCSTGKSAGWAPLRILSTYTAAL